MQTARSHLLAGLAAACLIGAAGCTSRPTFPKATIAETLQQFLTDESLKATVRLIERTLAVQLEFPAALTQVDGHVEIGPGFDEATRKVLTQIHRVSLSTDADIQFYVLLLSDPATPGAYLTMVRYMDDVRRANASMLDTPEIFARTIFELNVAGPEPLTLDQYVPREIRFEEFLSWQLARRIQYALAEMMHSSGAAEVGHVGGEFQDGEFAFTLDLAPSGGAGALDEATLQQAFQASTQIVAKVLESYHFDHFTTVRLIHPMTGRNLVLPKTSLQVFR